MNIKPSKEKLSTLLNCSRDQLMILKPKSEGGIEDRERNILLDELYDERVFTTDYPHRIEYLGVLRPEESETDITTIIPDRNDEEELFRLTVICSQEDNALYLNWIEVSENYRNEKLGSYLIEQLCDGIQGTNISTVYSCPISEQGRKLLTDCGFTDCEKLPEEWISRSVD